MTWVATGTAAMTAAEIAAAEAAAAAVATAAAETAAASAASAAAAPAITEAAATVLPEIAGSVAPEVAGTILEAAPGVVPPPATPLPPAGIEQVGQAAVPPPPATPAPPAGIEQVGQGFSQAELNAINQGQADAMLAQGTGTQVAGPAMNITPTPTGSELVSTPPGTPPEVPMPSSNLVTEPVAPFESMTRPELAEMTKAEVGSNPFMEGFKSVSDYIDKNPFKSAALGYIGLNMLGAFNQNSAQMPGQPSYSRNASTLSPNFRPGPYGQPNVYKPTYASGGIISLQGGGGPVERMSAMNTAMNPQGGLYPQGMIDKTQYATPIQRPVSSEMVSEVPAYDRSNPLLMAKGGIASFAKGTPRDSYSEFQRYHAMMEGKKPTPPDEPAWVRSAGIVEDNDPDTKYQDALTASIIRQGKINKRANMAAPSMPRPTPMGTINLNPPGTQQAASGGIMGYNLGGYADGGNPRLLKGPGDGMSDNIPAVIGRRQPARLADGEFVVPADVVSHLGNGSTDAGAKKLHEMMDKVRMARTGKKKQAPAVKPKKYMPA
jgi:hypothetical protein